MSQSDQPSVYRLALALTRPPAGLPDDFSDIYLRASTLLLTATLICTKPGGGICSPAVSADWTEGGVAAQYGALKSGWDRLGDVLTRREVELLADALEVYESSDRLVEAVRPLFELLAHSVDQLGDSCPQPSAPPPGGWLLTFGRDPAPRLPNPGHVVLRRVWDPYQVPDAARLAHALQDGISALSDLRMAVCEWAKRRRLASPEPPAGAAGVMTLPDQYVTLDQVAALVNRSKKTLERLLADEKSKMPKPDVEGGGGKPHEWLWSKLRPWLEEKFNRKLPEHFPRSG
jgi:hypothetical protein